MSQVTEADIVKANEIYDRYARKEFSNKVAAAQELIDSIAALQAEERARSAGPAGVSGMIRSMIRQCKNAEESINGTVLAQMQDTNAARLVVNLKRLVQDLFEMSCDRTKEASSLVGSSGPDEKCADVRSVETVGGWDNLKLRDQIEHDVRAVFRDWCGNFPFDEVNNRIGDRLRDRTPPAQPEAMGERAVLGQEDDQ